MRTIGHKESPSWRLTSAVLIEGKKGTQRQLKESGLVFETFSDMWHYVFDSFGDETKFDLFEIDDSRHKFSKFPIRIKTHNVQTWADSFAFVNEIKSLSFFH